MALPVTRPQTELFVGMVATTNTRRITYCGYPNLASEDIPVGMPVSPVDPDDNSEIHLVKIPQPNDQIIGVSFFNPSSTYKLGEDGRKYYPKGSPVPLLQEGEIVQFSETAARYGDEVFARLEKDGDKLVGYIGNNSSTGEQINYARYMGRIIVPGLVWVRYDIVL